MPLYPFITLYGQLFLSNPFRVPSLSPTIFTVRSFRPFYTSDVQIESHVRFLRSDKHLHRLFRQHYTYIKIIIKIYSAKIDLYNTGFFLAPTVFSGTPLLHPLPPISSPTEIGRTRNALLLCRTFRRLTFFVLENVVMFLVNHHAPVTRFLSANTKHIIIRHIMSFIFIAIRCYKFNYIQ